MIESDETLMAERIGLLQEENQQLRKTMRGDADEFGAQIRTLKQKVASWIVFQVVLALLVVVPTVYGVGWFIYKLATGKKTADCYIEQGAEMCDVYKAYRVVSWGYDDEIGSSTNLDEVLSIVRQHKCELPEKMEVKCTSAPSTISR